MRLFIGVELDETSRAQAAGVADAVRERLARTSPGLDARWVPAENLHVTLWFIGEANDERAAAIRAALQPSLATAAFELSMNGCGAFPPAGPPSVFWLGVNAGKEPLRSTYAEIAHRMVALGYQAERRSYTPHVTIARVRNAPRGSSRMIRDVLAAAAVTSAVCRVEGVTLFRSRLSPRGASYEPLQRVPLA